MDSNWNIKYYYMIWIRSNAYSFRQWVWVLYVCATFNTFSLTHRYFPLFFQKMSLTYVYERREPTYSHMHKHIRYAPIDTCVEWIGYQHTVDMQNVSCVSNTWDIICLSERVRVLFIAHSFDCFCIVLFVHQLFSIASNIIFHFIPKTRIKQYRNGIEASHSMTNQLCWCFINWIKCTQYLVYVS